MNYESNVQPLYGPADFSSGKLMAPLEKTCSSSTNNINPFIIVKHFIEYKAMQYYNIVRCIDDLETQHWPQDFKIKPQREKKQNKTHKTPAVPQTFPASAVPVRCRCCTG